MKYELPSANISGWKSYLTYDYKNGDDSYQIVFVFNEKKKVTGVVFLKNPQMHYDYPDKEVGGVVKFEAPKGKKIKTETIAGKKVYLLPKGTKVVYDKDKMKKLEKDNVELGDVRFELYDPYGDLIGTSEAEGIPTYIEEGALAERIFAVDKKTGEYIKSKTKNDLFNYKMILLKNGVPYYATQSDSYDANGNYQSKIKFTKKSVKYRYYVLKVPMWCYGKVQYAPEYVYFRFV